MKSEIKSKSAPTPVGPYSQAIEAGAVYCSGQIGTDPSTGELVQGVAAQTARAIANLQSVLMAAGLNLKDVAKTTVFMVDLSEYSAMNEEYAKHFNSPYPARSTVQAAALPKGAKVEIDAIAVR